MDQVFRRRRSGRDNIAARARPRAAVGRGERCTRDACRAVPVVKTTVATPLAFVGDVPLANDPPAPVFVHVTV